ncbi:hypothetical protein [Micromonospora sp. NBC_00421]|uniref:hypothetical protein n=1 Tax=Micromonospora sp. NBC_00421 TaxID=2975976 RepID=UPI002E1E3AA3
MNAVVCRPNQFLLRRITFCPTEQKRRRFAGRDAAWYGTTWTCCGCGDSWTDGERHERPFRRGWRSAAVAAARRVWDEAAAFDPADHAAWVRAEVAA